LLLLLVVVHRTHLQLMSGIKLLYYAPIFACLLVRWIRFFHLSWKVSSNLKKECDSWDPRRQVCINLFSFRSLLSLTLTLLFPSFRILLRFLLCIRLICFRSALTFLFVAFAFLHYHRHYPQPNTPKKGLYWRLFKNKKRKIWLVVP
jgi:hypothetical protein